MIWLCAPKMVLGGENRTVATDENRRQTAAEFFEKKIRPALVEHCLECHSGETDSSGGLVLDSRVGWTRGGDFGPAVVPGDASKSLLMKAIEYADPEMQMPPDGKLDPSTIQAFRQWIRSGAVDPRESPGLATDTNRQSGLPVDRAQEHWAYRPMVIQRMVKPILFSNAETSSKIDRFIDDRLSEVGLKASPAAGRRALVRRLSFDLHGLPPSAETTESFLADTSPLGYQRLVDRLLASPRFGEHFARRWMDVVRYAESITLRGFILPQAWRYRDYLIASFNADRPFDQMIRDQLAGDLLAVDDLDETQRRAVATGFLAFGNSNLEDQDKTKLEFDHIDEQLETIGRAFLAQTIGCARCHDHKFDPIPTRDYYALAGIMRSTTPLKHANLSKWIEKPLPLDPATESYFQDIDFRVQAFSAELDALKSTEKANSKRANSVVPVDSLDGIVVDDADATFVGKWKASTFVKSYVGEGYRHDETEGKGGKAVTFEPPEIESGRYEVRMSYTSHENRATNVRVRVFSAIESTTLFVNQRKRPPEEGLWVSLGVFPFEKEGQAFVIVSNEDADGCVIVDAIQFRSAENGQRKTDSKVQDGDSTDAEIVAAKSKRLSAELKRLRSELDERPRYLTISESEPRQEIAIRIRGNVHQLGETVPRGFLTAIAPAKILADRIGSTGSGRVELADWIADKRNPLTGRVYANRLWSWLMGDGLVATENNFGTTGQTPSHPELLDLLATELMDHNWSTKHLVRTIVTSEAYRRSVTEDPDRIAVDPSNRLYSSGSLKRMPVESVRDAMLLVSGELDLNLGGSLILPKTSSDYGYQHDSTRRSVYQPVFRNSLPPLFGIFDFADSSVSVGQRSRSTVAPQSLAMMNHPWIVARARFASRRLLDDPSISDTSALIDRLYASCFSRMPDARERELCTKFLQTDQHELGDRETMPTHDRLCDLIQSLYASIDFRYLE